MAYTPPSHLSGITQVDPQENLQLFSDFSLSVGLPANANLRIKHQLALKKAPALLSSA